MRISENKRTFRRVEGVKSLGVQELERGPRRVSSGSFSSCGVQPIAVWEIEGLEDDLIHFYSPKMLQKFCHVLGIRPIELFGDDMGEPPVSANDLVELIHAECHSRGVTLEQFEDVIEWGQLSKCFEPPEKLLEVMTLYYLRRLCEWLRIDWRRVILSL